MTRAWFFVFLIITLLISIFLPAQTRRKTSKSRSPTSKPAAPQLEIPVAYRDLLKGASQAVVVTTSGWNSVDGSLQRFEKIDGNWHQVGERIPVFVGKNGLAWDGQAEPPVSNVKREGDGRSPAGILAIGEAFGFAPSAPDLKLPYLPLTDSIECVDDPSSSSYNQVVDRQEIANPDWNSSEKMRSIDVYKEGAVVNYNDQRFAGAGSCIFLHIWNGSGHGTAGCTAMPEDKLNAVLGWLDESKKPVLIQFPETVYKQLKSWWNLP
ncbi:MAG: L,D-transpeptidase family protein [Terriglobales bacterium]